MKKGIKSEQQGVYFSGGIMSKVKGRIMNHKASQQVKKQGLDLQKMEFLKIFCAKRGWHCCVRDTKDL
jgi:hypothetical protein